MIKKFRFILKIFVALGISILVPLGFYWLVDLCVYNYFMNTVPTGGADQFQAYIVWYTNYEWILFIAEFLINITVTVILLIFVLKLSRLELKGWFSLQNVSELAIGLLLSAIAISIVFFLLILTRSAYVVSWQPQFTINTIKYLLVFILVGISEELFYRGFIITSLRTIKSVPFVILLSSMIFSLVHFFNNEFNLLAFLNIMLIGVMLAYIFIKTKSLWLPTGYHILWNYFQGNVYGFNVSGVTISGIFTTKYKTNNILNGGVFGPEAGLITTFVTILAIVFLKWYLANRKTL